MGMIEKYVVNHANRAIDKVQNFGDKMSSILSKVQGYAGTAFEVAKNGETFVGINYGEVPNIRAAIKQYVLDIQTVLAKLNTEATTDNAIKGTELVKSVAAYVKAVDDVSSAYVSSLLAYSDKMYEYANGSETGTKGMKQNEASLAENVASEASDLASQAEVYDPKYDY